MGKTQELHEIVLTANSDGLKKADAEYKVFVAREKANDKIRVESTKASEKLKIEATKTANKQKLQDNAAVNKILIQQNNVKNQKEIIDYKNTQAEKIRIKRQAEAELKAQQKLDSKFTGQSTELGSIGAITQQIAYFKQLRDSANSNSKEFSLYSQKVNELTERKKALTGATGGLNTAIGSYMGTLIKAYGVQLAFNTSMDSARFLAMREMFQGSERDMEAFRQASANTVSDKSLIALSNQASDLNIAIKDQVILFAFAEQQADKYGTSTEEGFSKVFRIIQGSTRGLKDYGIVTSEFTKLTEKLAIEQGKEVDEQIRLQALIQLSNMTYDEAINKTMDMADWHETLGVQVKNVADEHGNFWDVLSSLNPVTGFFNVGLEDMAKKESKAADDAKLMISALNDFNNKVPVWGSATESLRQYFVNLSNQFLSTANDAQFMQDAVEGSLILRKGGDANVPTQGESKGKIKRSGTSGVKTKTEQVQELNFLEQLRKKINDLKVEINSLNALQSANDLFEYERLNIIDEKIKKQKELNELLREAARNLGFAGIEKTGAIVSAPGKLPFGTSPDLNPRSREIENAEREMQLANSMLTAFEGMNSFTLSMLEKTGLMETDFGQIVAVIQTLFGIGKEAFSIAGLIGDIISFLPGGSVIGGAISGGGGGGFGRFGNISSTPINRFSSGYSSQSPNVTVLLSTKMEKMDSYRVLIDGKEIEAKIGNSQLAQ